MAKSKTETADDQKHYLRMFLLQAKVRKHSNKPFKSGSKTNTVKDVIRSPETDKMAYTFHEDDSYVECRTCVMVRSIDNDLT